MPQKYIKRKTKPVTTYGETGEENKIQWITKSVGTFTGGGGGGTGTVDTEMSDTSTNAVQNKVIKEYVDKADENLTKVMPTDINVDSEHKLILEHDGTEITGQKKQVVVPPWKYSKYPDTYSIPNASLNIGEHINGWYFKQTYIQNANPDAPFASIGLVYVNPTGHNPHYEILSGSTDESHDYNPDNWSYKLAIPHKSGTLAVTSDVDTKVSKSGDTITGNLTITGGHLYTEYPSIDTHAANKKYVDDAVSGISLGIDVINIEYNPDTLAPVGTYDVSVFETAKKRTTKVLLTATGESYGILCDKTLENLDETAPNLMFASGLDEAHNYYVIDMDLRDGSLIIQISKEQGQAALESGVNIKTVNGESLLGSGNITIETIKVVEISDVPAEVTNGTLTDEQLTTLQSYDGNYIMFNHEKYYLQDKGHVEGYLTYTHTGYENNQMWLKSITITIATKTWVLNVVGVKPTVVLTQSDYDNLAVKDANTLYYIIG